MSTFRVQDFFTGSERARTTTSGTVVISGARLEELGDGLPHLRIEPRVSNGLTLTESAAAGEFAATSKLGIKLLTVSGVTQGLYFTSDGTAGKTHESFLRIRTGGGLLVHEATGELRANVDGSTITINGEGKLVAGGVASLSLGTGMFGLWNDTGILKVRIDTSKLAFGASGELTVLAGASGLQTLAPATVGKLVKFANDGQMKITDSILSESGTTVTVGGTLTATGNVGGATLSATGTATVQRVLVENGTAAAPSLALSSNPATGIYGTANVLSFSINGVPVWSLDAAGASFTNLTVLNSFKVGAQAGFEFFTAVAGLGGDGAVTVRAEQTPFTVRTIGTVSTWGIQVTPDSGTNPPSVIVRADGVFKRTHNGSTYVDTEYLLPTTPLTIYASSLTYGTSGQNTFPGNLSSRYKFAGNLEVANSLYLPEGIIYYYNDGFAIELPDTMGIAGQALVLQTVTGGTYGKLTWGAAGGGGVTSIATVSGAITLGSPLSMSGQQLTLGTVPVGQGGTGITSYTAGNYVRAASASALEQRTPAQVLSDIGAAASSHTHANLTFSNAGTGDASGTTYNGGTARTISYNSIGAPSTTGAGASGNWAINVTGTSNNITAFTINQNLGTGNSPSFSSLSLTTTITAGVGSAAAPSYTFAGNTSTGMYHISAGVLGFSVSGTERARITSTGVTATDFTLSSDRRLKRDIVPLRALRGGALAMLARMDAYQYHHTTHGQTEIGVIAQEVREVLPEAVFEDDDGMLVVAYDRVVPLLVAAVKELVQRVHVLEGRP